MTTITKESHRVRARQAINAARRGHLPKPNPSSLQTVQVFAPQHTKINGQASHMTNSSHNQSIEVYEDQFVRNSNLTRSARMRKFRFYQYKPIQDQIDQQTIHINPANSDEQRFDESANTSTPNSINRPASQPSKSSSTPTKAVLLPRDKVLQGKVAVSHALSKELTELDDHIIRLERRIAQLNAENDKTNDGDYLDDLFELVNQKNDLLRQQMQLNIIEQEKALERANEELTKELRYLVSLDDSRKTQADMERQQYLYNQSLALVNKRNELVLRMDEQERGIEDDIAMKARLKTVISEPSTRNEMKGGDQNCVIQ